MPSSHERESKGLGWEKEDVELLKNRIFEATIPPTLILEIHYIEELSFTFHHSGRVETLTYIVSLLN